MTMKVKFSTKYGKKKLNLKGYITLILRWNFSYVILEINGNVYRLQIIISSRK